MQRKRGLEIGRPLGFPLLVHGSWFPAGALLIAHLTVSAYGGHDLLASVLLSISTVLVFFVCVALKELAQAVVAGLVRTPFADVTLYIFGGIPRTTREPARPIQDVLIAFAGPVVAGALGATGLTASSHFHGLPGNVLWTVGIANVALAAANLLPGTPLDGGRAIAAVLSARTGDRRGAELTAARAGQIIGTIAFGLGVWFVLAGISTVRETAIGLWLIVGGLFVATLASRARRAARTLRAMGSAKAGEWAKPFTGRLAVDASVPGAGTYAIADGGRLAGVVAGRSKGTLVRDVMVPWTSDLSVRSTEPMSNAIGRLAKGSVLVVLDDNGAVRGVLDRDCVRKHL